MPESLVIDAVRISNEFLDLPLTPEDCDAATALARLAETRTACEQHGWVSALPRIDFFAEKIQTCLARSYQDSST